MKAANWDHLSAWFNAWLAADAYEREGLRARLSLEHPDLLDEADELTATAAHLPGFLETPAVVLAALDLAPDDPLLAVESMAGPYRVVGLIARGGMGDVYRATDIRLQRDVALKVLAQTKTADPQRVDRFMQEARVTALLDHPNVVRVYDVGHFDDRTYLVAELLEGETLRARIARGPMPVDEVLRIGIAVTRGLAAAHDAGLVHRDLKPDNIFLTRSGGTKILDFGIAKLAQDDISAMGLRRSPGSFSTAGIWRRNRFGAKRSIRVPTCSPWAPCCSKCSPARAPSRAITSSRRSTRSSTTALDALAERGDVPPALVDTVLRLLEKSSAARVQSSADLIAALESIGTVSSPHGRGRGWRTDGDSRGGCGMADAAGTRGADCGGGRGHAIAAAGIVSYSSRPTGVTLAVMPFESIPAAKDNTLPKQG